MDCNTFGSIFAIFDLSANKQYKKRTTLYQWFKSNLDKSYEITSSKYRPFDVSHVTLLKMWTAVLPV